MESTPPFDLDALMIFGKVVECRSLSRAAALLDMPKSTVSRKLSRLEADLGIKLLRKNTHQITVTDLGERIYSHSQKILSEANDIRAMVEGSRREPQGRLKVAMPVFMGVEYPSLVGSEFLRRYPQSQLEIRLVDSLPHPVHDGYDVVVGLGPLQDSTLIARKVFSLDCFLCASQAFVDNLSEPLTTPAQLNKLPFIDTDLYGGRRRLTLKKGRREYEVSPLVRARANSFQISKQYLLQDLGIGIMPRQVIVAGADKHNSLAPILPDWQAESIDLHMVYPHQLSFSNLISAFYETAVATLAPRHFPKGNH